MKRVSIKRVVFLIMLLLPALSSGAAITIRIEATFGARKKDCLSGFGLCSAKSSAIQAPGRKITLSLSADETELTMVTDLPVLDDHEGQVAGGMFIQEEDFRLPPDIVEAIGGPANQVIRAGSYPASYERGQATVVFPLVDTRTGVR